MGEERLVERAVSRRGVLVGVAATWVAPEIIDSIVASANAASAPSSADLSSSIQVSPPTADPGGFNDYTFNLVVTNAGPATATGVSYLLTSTFNFTNGGVVANGLTGFDRPTTFSETSNPGPPPRTFVTCTLTDPLPAGQSWTIHGTASVSQGSSLDMAITQLHGNEPDGNPGNNDSSVAIAP